MRTTHFKSYQIALLILMSFVLLILIGGAIFISIETSYTYLDGVYFCSLLVTSCGFPSDFTLITRGGKYFTMIFSSLSVFAFFFSLAALGDSVLKLQRNGEVEIN